MSKLPLAARENRLRRLARRNGLRLVKSRSRTPAHPQHGHYMLVDLDRNFVVSGGSPFTYSLSIDDVEAYLHG